MERWRLRRRSLGLAYRTDDNNSLQTFGEEKNCSHCPKFHIRPPPPGGEKPLPRYQGGKMDQSQNPHMNPRQCGDMCCRKRALVAQCAGALEGS